MCSRFVLPLLLLSICAPGSLQQVEPALLAQAPAQYLFDPPRDRQTRIELGPPGRSPYVFYYAPTRPSIPTHDYDYEGPVGGSSPAMLVQQRRSPGFPVLYLRPPSPGAVSDYKRFRSYPMAAVWEELEDDGLPRNHRPAVRTKSQKRPKKIGSQGPVYVRDHAPTQQSESEATLETKVKVQKKSKKDPAAEALELSTDGDRVEFQIQGHEGPATYIFGFDTGDGKNRQFRLEEKLKDGTVKGHYGYYDARGKLRAIKYLARPFEGYQEKHHESNNLSSKEE